MPLATVLLLFTLYGCHSFAQISTLEPQIIKSETGAGAQAYHYFLVAQKKLKQGDVNEAIWLLNKARNYDHSSPYLKLETANLLLIKKNTDEALTLIEEVLAQEPDNYKALVTAGRIYQQRDQSDAAKAVLEKALASDPPEQSIYLLLGRIYWDESDIHNTVRVFGKMVANIPDSYAAYFFYGKALLAAGELNQAEQALRKSLELEPSLTEPRLELLNIYKAQGESDKLIGMYQYMISDDPDNVDAILGLAEHHRETGNTVEAEKLLARLGKLSLDQQSIISKVFETYLETKKYDIALWVIEGMLKSAPKQSDLHYMAGIAADGLERDMDAVAHLIQVQPASRFYSNAVLHAALIYHDMGKIDRAIAVIQRAISQSSQSVEYYVYLGSFYEELERYDEALSALQQGLMVDDQNTRLHFKLGVIYDKMGQKQASIDTMKMVIKLSPDDAEALNYLGYTYADLGINLDEAETLIQTALKLKPNDGYITDSLAWVYFKRGQYSEALQLLKKAIMLVPDDPVILEHLGDVYMKLDSRDKAINYYQRSLDNNAKDKDTIRVKIRTLGAGKK